MNGSIELREHITGEMLTPGYWYNPKNVQSTYFKMDMPRSGKIHVFEIEIVTKIERPRIWLDTNQNLVLATQNGMEAWAIIEHGACAEISEHFLMLLRGQVEPMEVL